MDNRAIRLPPTTTRRNIFTAHPAQQPRRQKPRPDQDPPEPTIFQQPAEDELVERNSSGEYVTQAPTPVYKDMLRDADAEEQGQENELIALYGKPNTHWDVEEEIRAALKSSLRRKVASLDEDAWIFVGEGSANGNGKK
ncbi:hypothetical protein BDW02DRAFT_565567 [Decorospora gaudefroyi]|uniref:Uncharacterized protein n=1 Tax=Decorospora gaudefroyi TaxID=184978 RepID=A0A6A5KHR0_9PLEO|nr:hypothetical protein BDW02DRAFT_565567 [Decorospora gaudefroyi]